MKTAQAHNQQMTGHASITLEENKPQVCPKCNGEKLVMRRGIHGDMDDPFVCPTCLGQGHITSSRKVRDDIVKLFGE